ncbi:hypothetical protein GGI22_007773, partial [Coemansia erecta]
MHANSSAAESDSSTLVAAKNVPPADQPPATSAPIASGAPEQDEGTGIESNYIDDNASEHSGEGEANDEERPVRSRRGRPRNASGSHRLHTRRSRSASKSRSPQLSDSTRQEDDENDEGSSDHDAKSLRRSTTANAEGEDESGTVSAAVSAVDAVDADTPDSSGTAKHDLHEDSTTPPAEDAARLTRRQANAASPGRPPRRSRQQQQQKNAPSPPTPANGTGRRGRPPLHARAQTQSGTNASTPTKSRRHNGGPASRRGGSASGPLMIPDALLGKLPKSTTAIAKAAAAAAAALAESTTTAAAAEAADQLQQSSAGSSRMCEIVKEIEDVQEEYKFFRSLVRKSARDLWIELGNEWPPTLAATNTRFGKRRK